jgi:phage-related protein
MNIVHFRTASGREPVHDYVSALPEADRAAITGDMELVRDYGVRHAPVTTRKLKGKLWEIKTGARQQQRIFYCVASGDSLVLLHACKKQKQGSQVDDIDLAYKRMREVL